MYKRIRKLKYLKSRLGKKLFYNAWIRYLITSNLKLTHNGIFILYFNASFESVKNGILTSLNIVILVIIALWPIFITVFLLYNKDHLNEKSFQRKFYSMFLGNYTGRKRTVIYHTVFCCRRMFIVLAFFMYYAANTPKVVYCFLAVQSLYLLYIIGSNPHIENYFNILEIVNETCIIILLYMSLAFWNNPNT